MKIAQVIDLQWIRLARYCDFTGDTPAAVHARRRKGQWVDGVHCRIAQDGNVWVNVQAFNAWVCTPPEPAPPRQRTKPRSWPERLQAARQESHDGK